MPRPILLCLALLLALGCGARYSERYAEPSYERPRPSAAPMEATVAQEQAAGAWGVDLYDEDSSLASEGNDDRVSAGSRVGGDRPGRASADPPPAAGKTPDTRGLDRPLVVYLGYLKLRVKRLLETVDAITRITEEAGGYIESLGARVVVVRVPATDFEAVMATFAGLGDVLDRRVKALDVTAQFTDLRGRLGVAKEARERLLKLLEEIEDVQERLRILQEVKRLTEQIESMESTLSTLQNLVDYFTITIELEPVLEGRETVVHRSPFGWVRGLQAHLQTLPEGKGDVAMTLPDGFVLFDEDDAWQAKAADTTTLRAGAVANEPRGNDAFWANAVLHEMDGRDEELVEDGVAGRVPYRVFRNEDVQPRYYLVGVQVKGDRLFVVEVFYPNEAAYTRHHAAVVKALGTFRAK